MSITLTEYVTRSHKCPGLLKCTNHPKFRVIIAHNGKRYRGAHMLYPGTYRDSLKFTNIAAAIAYAHYEAERETL